MGTLNLEKVNNSPKKYLHNEINELFEEIKELEKNFEKFDINTIEENEESNLIEFAELEEFQTIEDLAEIKKPICETEKEKIEKPINPVTFRFRFNNEGKFENIDIKKPKLNTKSKKSFILKRIKIRKKENTESKETEAKLKFSKLKKVLSKLKRVIQNKSKEVEKPQQITK